MDNHIQNTNIDQKNNDNFVLFLHQLYILNNSPSFDMYVINLAKTSKKSILTDEVSPITQIDYTNLTPLVDVLLGKSKTNLDSDILNDLRYAFNVKRKIGFYKGEEFEFFQKYYQETAYKHTYLKQLTTDFAKKNSFVNF